jgi:RNA polymerase sigma-70 factor (ECF subfamily)
VDDATLLARAGRGDDAAFAALYGRHQGPLYRYAVHMCRDAANDIVQDTFLAVIRQPRGYDKSRGTVRQYLFGIARHFVMQRLSEMYAAPAVEPEVDDHTPLDDVLRVESVARVREAVDALPVAFREVVVLCELQEMTYEEASSLLGCPIGTVRSRLFRGRALLAKALAPSVRTCA